MESTVKIQLSSEEAALIENTEWILTKHQVIKKVYDLFGHIHGTMQEELKSFNYLLSDMKIMNGKISKGENYKLLPYVILDYPSQFARDNIFAVRTMFWWGNFFSVTLHVSGDNKKKFIGNSPGIISFLKRNNFFICINEEEWEHHFEDDNYIQAEALSDDTFNQIMKKPFLKIAKKLSVKKWTDVNTFIMDSFYEMLGFVQLNFPNGEKDLSPGSPIIGSDL
jgi:hypothetical protein